VVSGGGPARATSGFSTISAIGATIAGLIVIGIVIAAVILLRRGRPPSAGRESEVFRDLYVGLDSTYDNPLETEQETRFDDMFVGSPDESPI
jgi:hypothetical protein